ncbi:MAG: UDP-N-acetylmuramoyl-L-alanyl-D-glutamate--2,6-diaminopimelate ligase, partial [Terrimicrobiaceae bacterium]|nr:UDP-N-acetylmuramoyl-L-alanyl-D-glutamate--2,6-diaminopimelate ligase [Terrimicrobiaceae bacterium]
VGALDAALDGLPAVRVPNPRRALALAAASWYDHPSRDLRVVGVTGTNGKTTTTFLCAHLLNSAGRPCGLVGTVQYAIGQEILEAPRTTPEAPELQALLARMKAAGCRAAAMEVSSHALDQHRADGVEFDVAAFTNLTRDHLDYHGTMEAYFEAKARLFEAVAAGSKKGRAIINGDDRFGHRLIARFEKRCPVITYGCGARADFRAADVRADMRGTTFALHARGRSYLVRMPLIGLFNVSNALAALASAAALGLEVRAAVAALAEAPQIPGRLERVPSRRNFQVFVDYAHTDDALRNVLQTLRGLEPRRILTVVGCGGDRDRTKRAPMAAAASELSDWTILTSDNPRGEDPAAILAEMRPGLRAGRGEEIVERAEAIRRAVAMAGAGDIVLIAGKGHEKYQEAHGVRTPFDDVSVARNAIEARPVELEETA